MLSGREEGLGASVRVSAVRSFNAAAFTLRQPVWNPPTASPAATIPTIAICIRVPISILGGLGMGLPITESIS
jgi:hypothetical protein